MTVFISSWIVFEKKQKKIETDGIKKYPISYNLSSFFLYVVVVNVYLNLKKNVIIHELH